MFLLRNLILFFLVIPSVTQAALSSAERARQHQEQVTVPNPDSRATLTANGQSCLVSPAAVDLRISEINSPAHFTQDVVSVAKMKNGQWVTVWQDEREGAKKIFLQLVDSLGSLSGTNQMMIGSTVGAEIVDPKIAMDTSGRVFLFYRDRTNGLLYGARYTSALAVDLTPFLVNDTTNGAFAGLYDVDIYPDGRLVIVWENYDISGNTIQMRIYSNTGVSVIAPTIVNSDAASNAHWAPEFAGRPNSAYLMAWEDYRSVDADV